MSQNSTAAVDSTETIIEPAPDSEAEVPTVRLVREATVAPESEAVLTPLVDTLPSTDHTAFAGEFGDGSVAPRFDGEPVGEGEDASLEAFEVPDSSDLQ